MNKTTVEQIAEVAHEVNRALCLAFGDDSHKSWRDAPEWQKESARAGVRLHLGDPNLGPEASHVAWAAFKFSSGWSFGPAKDESLRTHPCLVPFDALPPEQQAKDYVFRAVVHSVSQFLDA